MNVATLNAILAGTAQFAQAGQQVKANRDRSREIDEQSKRMNGLAKILLKEKPEELATFMAGSLGDKQGMIEGYTLQQAQAIASRRALQEEQAAQQQATQQAKLERSRQLAADLLASDNPNSGIFKPGYDPTKTAMAELLKAGDTENMSMVQKMQPKAAFEPQSRVIRDPVTGKDYGAYTASEGSVNLLPRDADAGSETTNMKEIGAILKGIGVNRDDPDYDGIAAAFMQDIKLPKQALPNPRDLEMLKPEQLAFYQKALEQGGRGVQALEAWKAKQQPAASPVEDLRPAGAPKRKFDPKTIKMFE